MLIRIAKEPLGSAFPKDMGKLTKVQLTTGIIPHSSLSKQVVPIFTMFGSACLTPVLINSIPEGGSL